MAKAKRASRPRKRAPGGGRKSLGGTAGESRRLPALHVTVDVYDTLQAIAIARGATVAAVHRDLLGVGLELAVRTGR